MKRMDRIHIIILLCKKRFSFILYLFDFLRFESLEENLNLCITTKVCSFGNTPVEKIEVCLKKNNLLFFLNISFSFQRRVQRNIMMLLENIFIVPMIQQCVILWWILSENLNRECIHVK